MSEEVERHIVMNGSEVNEMVLTADHDRIVSALTEAGVEMQAECDQLAERVESLEATRKVELAATERLAERCRELEVERDEADRRAGAAERKLAFEVDSRRRRDSWLRKAKEEAGYSQNETFDRAWAETLGKANERDILRAEVERLHMLLKEAGDELKELKVAVGFRAHTLDVIQRINEALEASR